MESDIPHGHTDYVTKAFLVQCQRQRTTTSPKAEFISCKLAHVSEECGFPVMDYLTVKVSMLLSQYLITYTKFYQVPFLKIEIVAFVARRLRAWTKQNWHQHRVNLVLISPANIMHQTHTQS